MASHKHFGILIVVLVVLALGVAFYTTTSENVAGQANFVLREDWNYRVTPESCSSTNRDACLSNPSCVWVSFGKFGTCQQRVDNKEGAFIENAEGQVNPGPRVPAPSGPREQPTPPVIPEPVEQVSCFDVNLLLASEDDPHYITSDYRQDTCLSIPGCRYNNHEELVFDDDTCLGAQPNCPDVSLYSFNGGGFEYSRQIACESVDGCYFANGGDSSSQGDTCSYNNIPTPVDLSFIPDDALRACVLEKLTELGPNTPLVRITDLSCEGDEDEGRFVQSLEGIQHLSSLHLLSLSNNLIQDIAPLSSLQNLQTVYLDNNQLEDISALASLEQLEQLSIYENQIADLSALANLDHLQSLSASDNRVQDVRLLGSPASLRSLGLDRNMIEDISALSQISTLVHVHLDENEIEDIGALGSLRALQRIEIDSNNVISVDSLNSLENLELIFLSDNCISDFSALEQLENIRSITGRDNQREDCFELADLDGDGINDNVDQCPDMGREGLVYLEGRDAGCLIGDGGEMDGCLTFQELIALLNAYYAAGDVDVEFAQLISLLNSYYGQGLDSISCEQ